MPDTISLEQILNDAPDNFVIQDALIRCYEIVSTHNHIVCSVSGGGDSDVMLDMLLRCGARDKTDFVFFNTGLEYQATLEHLDFLEKKYGITILRGKPIKSIPTSCREYGIPFWSKEFSQKLYYMQHHDFQYEDEDYCTLMDKYPKMKGPIKWWCNERAELSRFFIIDRAPYMKQFIMGNHPDFKISDKCCTYTKKKVFKHFVKGKGYDLSCVGLRKCEGGTREAVHKTCYSDNGDIHTFRPIFWFRDSDKEDYCNHYGVTHSRCYTEYGLKRTGCVGCPYNKNILEELEVIKQYEPKLYKAAIGVFGKSYEYTRKYLEFREEMKKNAT